MAGHHALVIGGFGQDGSYLCEQLRERGVEVATLGRQGLTWDGHTARDVTVSNQGAMRDLIAAAGFDEIYYLAAHHHSAEGIGQAEQDLVRRSFEVHVDGLINVLDGMVAARSSAGLFYAASSHVFGIVSGERAQTEETPMQPVCAYGVSKAAGVHLCRLYRHNYGVRASAGFLYNHESPRRPPHFLSRKVARAVVEIERGVRHELVVGSLDAQVDWGYCPEYTMAMQQILNVADPGDYIIASGRTITVREFIAAVFSAAGLDWQKYTRQDPDVVRKQGRGLLMGDPSKLARATGWSAQTTAERLACIMLDAERKGYRAQ